MAILLFIGHSALVPKFAKFDTTISVSTINEPAEFPSIITSNTVPVRETMVNPLGTQRLQELTMNVKQLLPPDTLQQRTGDFGPSTKDMTASATDEPEIPRVIRPKRGKKETEN